LFQFTDEPQRVMEVPEESNEAAAQWLTKKASKTSEEENFL